MSIFLQPEEIATLTGRKVKAKQIEMLRRMGVPYFVNATGHPVVTRAAVEGTKGESVQTRWMPNVIRRS